MQQRRSGIRVGVGPLDPVVRTKMAGTGGELDERTLWGAMRALLDRFSRSVDQATFVDDCLDAIVEALAADRGLVVLTGEDGARHAINARAAGRSLGAKEREEISATLVRRAHDEGRTVIWPDADPSAASASVMDLSIAAALAVPIRRPGEQARVHGVLYVDFRDPRRLIEAPQRELLEAAGVLIGSVIAQSQELLRVREDLREARIHMPGAAAAPSLEELLRPTSMEPLRRDVLASAHGDSPVLIVGESGTGKTLLATAIAEVSGRTPVVRAMLGASDDLNTITSELFGHLRGAFSGAVGKRVGVVEHADGGTLILDEVLNLPMHAQQLLLDFTQFGTYRPLGWDRPEPKHASVRVIGATHGDLAAAVRDGRFREDLYYRLAGATIHLPPLRERREDAPGLAIGALRRYDPSRDWALSLRLRRLLVSPALRWPGNVRQLEAVIRRARERAALRDRDAERLTLEDLSPRDLGLDRWPEGLDASGPEPTEAPPTGGLPGRASSIEARRVALDARRDELLAFERELVLDALAKHDGVVARAARELGIPRTSLVSRMRTLEIEG